MHRSSNRNTLTMWLPKEDQDNVNASRQSNEVKGNPTVFPPLEKRIGFIFLDFWKKKFGELKERENNKQKKH